MFRASSLRVRGPHFASKVSYSAAPQSLAHEKFVNSLNSLLRRPRQYIFVVCCAAITPPPSSKFQLEALRFQFRIFLGIEAKEISLPSLRRVGSVARQLEHTQTPHLVIEIAAVEAHIEDGLIEVLQLLDGELLWQQFKPHWFEMNLLAQRLFRLTENLVVVESQRRHRPL